MKRGNFIFTGNTKNKMNRRTFNKSAFVLAGTYIYSNWLNGSTPIEHREVNYQIQIRSAACNYLIKINDVYVAFEEESSNIFDGFHVNEWVFEGDNYLSFELFGPSLEGESLPESASFSVKLFEVENNQPAEIARIEIPQFNQEKPSKIVVPFVLKNLPFLQKNYDELCFIDWNNPQVQSQFWETCENYFALFKNQDLTKIIALNEGKSQAYDDRYYIESGHKSKAFKNAVEEAFNTQILMPFKEESFEPKLYLYDRLITLTYVWSIDIHFVRYVQRGSDYISYFNTYWALNEDGEFYIYR